MTADIAVLVNPSAGRGAADRAAQAAATVLRHHGSQVDLWRCDSIQEMDTRLADAVAQRVPTVVVVGGDGTVSVALQHLAETDTVLGVIPAGTGNDFAHALGLPRSDPAAAAEVINAGHTLGVDLGRAGTRWFGTVLAAGFDARVNERANRMRWPRGPLKFPLATALELRSFDAIEFELVADGRRLELAAMFVAVGNAPMYGSGMRICPEADLGDGLLDVTVVRRIGRLELVRLFRHVYPGTHLGLRQVLSFRTSQLTIRAREVRAYADGEFAAATPVQVECVPAALRVLAPGWPTGRTGTEEP